VIEFLDFVLNVFLLGDWLDGIASGDAEERERPSYDAPQMRHLRWLAWAVVLVYVVVITAIPILAATSPASDRWLSGASGGVLLTLIVGYIVAVCVGFVLLRRYFRRQRQLIAARLAAGRSQ
jgi:hypothetical protein